MELLLLFEADCYVAQAGLKLIIQLRLASDSQSTSLYLSCLAQFNEPFVLWLPSASP